MMLSINISQTLDCKQNPIRLHGSRAGDGTTSYDKADLDICEGIQALLHGE